MPSRALRRLLKLCHQLATAAASRVYASLAATLRTAARRFSFVSVLLCQVAQADAISRLEILAATFATDRRRLRTCATIARHDNHPAASSRCCILAATRRSPTYYYIIYDYYYL